MLQIVDRSVNSLISNWKTLDLTFVPWSASGSATEVPRVPVEAEDDEAEETETASKGKGPPQVQFRGRGQPATFLIDAAYVKQGKVTSVFR